MHRLKLVKEIFWTPIWGTLAFIWFILGHSLNILSLLGIDVSVARENIMNFSFVGDIIEKWWWFTIVIFSLAIAEGFYKKARGFLGETVITKEVKLIPKKEGSNNGDNYVWVSVENGEKLDLVDCFADIKIRFRSDKDWLDCTDQVNPNGSQLQWVGFFEDLGVTVRRNGKARLNIARTENRNQIAFIFKEGYKTRLEANEYYIEIVVNGKMGEKNIKEIVLRGFLILESGIAKGHELTGHTSTERMEGDELVKRTRSFTESIPPTAYHKLIFIEGNLSNE